MSNASFMRYEIDSSEQVPIAGRIREALGTSIDAVATAGDDYVSFELVGGLGFGDFSPASSDIDSWIVMSDSTPRERLEAARQLNEAFKEVQQDLTAEGLAGEHNFRHPPTFLSEKEATAYQRAFAAKVGLPRALGVFPTLRGKDRMGEFGFTDEELFRDLAYSSNVFHQNVLYPPTNGVEDPVRYCFKRATYFMRFKLLHDEGSYVPTKDDLLSACERDLPEWRPLIPMLQTIHTGDKSTWPDLATIQRDLDYAMHKGVEAYWAEGSLDETGIVNGGLRTQLHWTMEKTRWDFLHLPRTAESLRESMTNGPVQLWGFSFSDIGNLLARLNEVVPADALMKDWSHFGDRHIAMVSAQPDETLPSYYDEVYHPTMTAFFDKATELTDGLF